MTLQGGNSGMAFVRSHGHSAKTNDEFRARIILNFKMPPKECCILKNFLLLYLITCRPLFSFLPSSNILRDQLTTVSWIDLNSIFIFYGKMLMIGSKYKIQILEL